MLLRLTLSSKMTEDFPDRFPKFRPTLICDGVGEWRCGCYVVETRYFYLQNIVEMSEVAEWSPEEVRWSDYEKGRHLKRGLMGYSPWSKTILKVSEVRKRFLDSSRRTAFGVSPEEEMEVDVDIDKNAGGDNLLLVEEEKPWPGPVWTPVTRMEDVLAKLKSLGRIDSGPLTVEICGLNLKDPLIYTKPNIQTLNLFTVGGACMVYNFTAGFRQVGEIRFFGQTNVYKAPLEKIFRLTPQGIKINWKVPESKMFRKPAEVTLFHAYSPQDGEGTALEKERFKALEDNAKMNGWECLKYDKALGTVSFRINTMDAEM